MKIILVLLLLLLAPPARAEYSLGLGLTSSGPGVSFMGGDPIEQFIVIEANPSPWLDADYCFSKSLSEQVYGFMGGGLHLAGDWVGLRLSSGVLFNMTKAPIQFALSLAPVFSLDNSYWGYLDLTLAVRYRFTEK